MTASEHGLFAWEQSPRESIISNSEVRPASNDSFLSSRVHKEVKITDTPATGHSLNQSLSVECSGGGLPWDLGSLTTVCENVYAYSLVEARLQQLFFDWLALPETTALFQRLQEDNAKYRILRVAPHVGDSSSTSLSLSPNENGAPLAPNQRDPIETDLSVNQSDVIQSHVPLCGIDIPSNRGQKKSEGGDAYHKMGVGWPYVCDGVKEEAIAASRTSFFSQDEYGCVTHQPMVDKRLLSQLDDGDLREQSSVLQNTSVLPNEPATSRTQWSLSPLLFPESVSETSTSQQRYDTGDPLDSGVGGNVQDKQQGTNVSRRVSVSQVTVVGDPYTAADKRSDHGVASTTRIVTSNLNESSSSSEIEEAECFKVLDLKQHSSINNQGVVNHEEQSTTSRSLKTENVDAVSNSNDVFSYKAGMLTGEYSEVCQSLEEDVAYDSDAFPPLLIRRCLNSTRNTGMGRIRTAVEALYFQPAYSRGLDIMSFESEIVVKLLKMPRYMSGGLFSRILAGERVVSTPLLSQEVLMRYLEERFVPGDSTLSFFNLLSSAPLGTSVLHLLRSDLQVLVKEILDCHPGLEFLQTTPGFKDRYADTIVVRLFYVFDPVEPDRISLRDLRRFDARQQVRLASRASLDVSTESEVCSRAIGTPFSSLSHSISRSGCNGQSPGGVLLEDCTTDDNASGQKSFLSIIKELERAPSTQEERLFFSYEHFYVIYSIFRELDTNHDFLLEKHDFLRYDEHALSNRTVDRIFEVLKKDNFSLEPCSLLPTGGHQKLEAREVGQEEACTEAIQCPVEEAYLSYEDFVVFLLNDEDKTTTQSLQFWFRIVDLDGDGYIRPYEIKYFYDEQRQRFDALNQEAVSLSDLICQMTDLLRPKVAGEFTLADFTRHKTISGIFFDMLISLTKALNYEFRDPYLIRQEANENPVFTPWDRFCAREYQVLIVSETTEEDVDPEGPAADGQTPDVLSNVAGGCGLILDKADVESEQVYLSDKDGDAESENKTTNACLK